MPLLFFLYLNINFIEIIEEDKSMSNNVDFTHPYEQLSIEDAYEYLDYLWNRYEVAEANGDYDYSYELRIEIDKLVKWFNL